MEEGEKKKIIIINDLWKTLPCPFLIFPFFHSPHISTLFIFFSGREIRQKEIYKLIIDTNPQHINKFFRTVSELKIVEEI